GTGIADMTPSRSCFVRNVFDLATPRSWHNPPPHEAPLRSFADRVPPRRRRAHGHLQSAPRAAARRLHAAAHRGHRRRALAPASRRADRLIRGDVRFEGDLIDDFVLLRSDGYPTYHLSVVVDDIDMAITHVARGDDHLSNTPKHILLFRALGAEVPVFAHLPLILGSDKKR